MDPDTADRQEHLDFLTQFLAERDADCPGCQYNLRGLQTGTCPECGSELELSIGLTEPRLGAFVSGAVGLAAGLGFNTLLICWVAWMWVVQGRRNPGLREVSPAILGAIVTGIALYYWLTRRRRIRLMNHNKRWVLAGACYALSLLLAIMFFSLVR